jgi:hypothetical protein
VRDVAQMQTFGFGLISEIKSEIYTLGPCVWEKGDVRAQRRSQKARNARVKLGMSARHFPIGAMGTFEDECAHR